MTGDGYTDMCAYHHRMEPVGRLHYRICGECWHLYKTRWHLVWAELREWRVLRRPARIWSCPLCVHDW